MATCTVNNSITGTNCEKLVQAFLGATFYASEQKKTFADAVDLTKWQADFQDEVGFFIKGDVPTNTQDTPNFWTAAYGKQVYTYTSPGGFGFDIERPSPDLMNRLMAYNGKNQHVYRVSNNNVIRGRKITESSVDYFATVPVVMSCFIKETTDAGTVELFNVDFKYADADSRVEEMWDLHVYHKDNAAPFKPMNGDFYGLTPVKIQEQSGATQSDTINYIQVSTVENATGNPADAGGATIGLTQAEFTAVGDVTGDLSGDILSITETPVNSGKYTVTYSAAIPDNSVIYGLVDPSTLVVKKIKATVTALVTIP